MQVKKKNRKDKVAQFTKVASHIKIDPYGHPVKLILGQKENIGKQKKRHVYFYCNNLK